MGLIGFINTSFSSHNSVQSRAASAKNVNTNDKPRANVTSSVDFKNVKLKEIVLTNAHVPKAQQRTRKRNLRSNTHKDKVNLLNNLRNSSKIQSSFKVEQSISGNVTDS